MGLSSPLIEQFNIQPVLYFNLMDNFMKNVIFIYIDIMSIYIYVYFYILYISI